MSNSAAELVRERNSKFSRLKNVGRKVVHIINPVSGSHRYYDETRKAVDEIGGKIIVSDHSGQITDLVADALAKDPYSQVVVYGGDGSVYEAINGIMLSGHADTAVLSVIPSGSGNDFSTYANDSGVIPKGETRKIDLVKTVSAGKVRYFDNMMNIGFDCSVVDETFKIRKSGVVKGSAAYIAGVAKVLAVKKPLRAKITLSGCMDITTGEEVDDYTVENDFLLTACANAPYCGGGFKAAPLAGFNDGFMDILIVNNVTRAKFVSLVGEYHSGTYISLNGVLKPQYRNVLDYRRCRRMTITGPEKFCLDGEVFETGEDRTVCAEAVPDAINFAAI